jgi:hypothetical protein
LALPNIPANQISELITGASGHVYRSLSAGDRDVVVVQIMSAISEAFYYLVAITAIGFITSLSLSVSISPLNVKAYCMVVNSASLLQPKKLFLSGGAVAA